MFKGFNLNLGNGFNFLSATDTYLSYLSQQESSIQRSLDDLYFKDGTIDSEKLKEAWFPCIEDVHVFISHSHSDLKLAQDLACWLYDNFQIKSFIDSHVWWHANDLLRKIDNEYALQPSGKTYDYYIRNLTTSNVHMLLSSALNTMIDKCEALFFINTDKSISKLGLVDRPDEDRTLSPWIMSELTISRIIQKKQAISTRKEVITKSLGDGLELATEALHSYIPKFRVSHKVSLSHLHNMTEADLKTWSDSNQQRLKYDALTILYNKFSNQNFQV